MPIIIVRICCIRTWMCAQTEGLLSRRMKMKQGMITGNMDGSYRRGRTTVTGHSKSRRTSAEKTRRTASTGIANGKQGAVDRRGIYDENVQYDVSEGRSRVAQILRQQQNMYSYEGDSCVTDQGAGASEDAVPEKGQMTNRANEKTPVKTGTVTAEQTAESEAETDGEDVSENADTQGYSESDIEYMERLLESMRKSRENISKTNAKAKKTLTYNYRKVSGAIMRAKTRIQAGNALASAKSELSGLKRKAGSGQYKDEELQIAINHANKMIRTARRKMSHLKLEEMQKKSDNDTVHSKERKNENIKKQEHVQNSTAVKADLDQQVPQLKKRLKQITKAEKNGHCRSENYDLLQADMEYLKRKIDLLRQDQSGQSSDTAQQNGMESAAGTDIVTGTTTVTGTDTSQNASAAQVAEQGMAERADSPPATVL